MDLPILYEDVDIVAVNKPAGVMTHPDGRSSEETASDWFAAHYPESATVGETQRLQDGTEITRPGVMHRLDRETSGVLVFAKTPEAHTYLKEAFQERQVHKTYLAFVYGVPKDRKGIIDFPIGRSTQDFRLRSAQPKAKGILREALTRWEIISDIGTHALMKVMPETGRTHQIRVPYDLGFNRLGLHAYELDIQLPSGENKIITAPLPTDLVPAIARFPNTEYFQQG